MVHFLSDLWQFTISVFTNWVAIVTGVTVSLLSLIVEKVFRKDVSPKVVLLGFIAFLLVAFFMAWRSERNEVRTLRQQIADLSVPKLSGAADFVTVAPAGAHREDSIVTIIASIENTGAPSIAKEFQAIVTLQTRKRTMRLIEMPPPSGRL